MPVIFEYPSRGVYRTPPTRDHSRRQPLGSVPDWQALHRPHPQVSEETRVNLWRIRQVYFRVRGIEDTPRRLGHALRLMRVVASQMQIPEQVVQVAEDLYISGFHTRPGPGRKIARIAASLYLAVRLLHLPRYPQEFVDTIHQVHRPQRGITRRQIWHEFTRLCRNLDITPPPIKPEAFILRIVSEHQLPPIVLDIAMQVCRRLRKKRVGLRPPIRTLAAAILYHAARRARVRLSQEDCASMFGLGSRGAVCERYQELLQILHEENRL
ncbi:MAG: hypothetical protein DRH24_18210 [Deltaproteobacteria bacterium]|nr:MAG: hypothetical protein DRH24_18210 [Deltaproteobacteria bacterium]